MRTWSAVGAAFLCLHLVGCGQNSEANKKPKSLYEKTITTDIKVGTGPVAEDGDLALVEYVGKFPGSGKQFDSNVNNPNNKTPLAFHVGSYEVIKGFSDGARGMRVGGEREVKVPYDSGYGEVGSPPAIPPYSDLNFNLKLLYVVKDKERNVFDYEDVKPGTGPEVKVGSKVTVHYTGKYLNDYLFDDTRKRGQPVTFTVGKQQAISGIDKGVVGMKQGGSRKLWLPPDTAWGMGGSEDVAGNQVLVYEIELLKVE
ncbi:MAG: FKBP-type peptidyl-prolyl cis-trans isomerase [Fimbriimonadaceae bacterium]|nr:FKBP-type peptidyl-prolyl cis-trans isomerase [Fimbriimonadaceae bacterium]QYK55428.1 MAG: FKBP-type peptidyl-prolyl cis-trans isomerase [Fimbriimonadaceae bacterium]